MSRLHRFVVACILAGGAVAAPAPDEISGTVTDSDNGKPISHARVTVTVWTDRRVSHGDLLVALTDDDGHFRFSGLPKGEYEVRAGKAGHVPEVRSSHSRARADDLSSPVTFRLTPMGWLAVRVVDETGSRIDGAEVTIVQRPGEVPPRSLGWGLSADAKDVTRRVALPRGTYKISAVSPGTGTLLRARGQTFFPTYYPSTTSFSQAEGIDVVPGKEVQAEVRVTLIPARQIHGRLAFAGTLIQVSILPAGSHDYYSMWGLPQVRSDTAEFRVSGLTPGLYELEARVCLARPCTVAAMFHRTVQVTDADIDNLVISDADRVPGQ